MSQTFDVNLKNPPPKPKWYQFRNRLSNMFLWLAKKCYRENPEVGAFFIKQQMDMDIYGQSITHVDYSKVHRNHPGWKELSDKLKRKDR